MSNKAREVARYSDGSRVWYWHNRQLRSYPDCPECGGTALVNESAWSLTDTVLYPRECQRCRNRFLATQDARGPWREQRERITKRVTELETAANHELRMGNRKKLRPGEWETIEKIFFSERGVEHRQLLREWWALYPPVVSAPVVVWQA